MMSLTFGLFTQVSGSGPLGPLVLVFFLVISVSHRLFQYFGSYSGISVIPSYFGKWYRL